MDVPGQNPIVFFDGVCGLCNRFVDRLLRADKQGVLRFSPLQGETARKLLPELPADTAEWSLVYLDEAGAWEQSDGSLRICRRLGGWYGVLAWARWVPRPLRDAVYRVIARFRYRWFGRRTSCRVPSPEERERFLP